MTNLFYDLHIHSCLSPCGDDDMTPANIAGMAAIKGLDVVALTDHNTCRNCGPFMKAAAEYGLLAIPGMELTTMEEIHAVCLFPDLYAALSFDEYVYSRLQKIPNRTDIFGNQFIYGDDDRIIGTEPYFLTNATDISFDEVWDLAADYGGVMFPAHLDKTTTSLISNLGFIPEGSRFAAAEIKDLSNLHRLRREHPYLEHCRIISDSDAHYLGDIHEAELTIPLEERTPQALLDYLSGA